MPFIAGRTERYAVEAYLAMCVANALYSGRSPEFLDRLLAHVAERVLATEILIADGHRTISQDRRTIEEAGAGEARRRSHVHDSQVWPLPCVMARPGDHGGAGLVDPG